MQKGKGLGKYIWELTRPFSPQKGNKSLLTLRIPKRNPGRPIIAENRLPPPKDHLLQEGWKQVRRILVPDAVMDVAMENEEARPASIVLPSQVLDPDGRFREHKAKVCPVEVRATPCSRCARWFLGYFGDGLEKR
jgi:hypothetical protein